MIAMNRAIKRFRRRLLMMAVLALVAACVAWAHSGMQMDHMPGHEGAMAVCLAVMETAAVAFAALGLRKAAVSRSEAIIVLLEEQWVPSPLPAPARAGPSLLQVSLR